MLKRELSKITTTGVILIHGNNDYLSKNIKSDLIEVLLDNKLPDFNFDLFNDETFDLEKIIQVLFKAPFGAKKRVVLIKNIDKIDYRKLSQLLPYFSRIKKTYLVLYINKELDKATLKKKFYKGIPSNRFIWLKNLNDIKLKSFIKGFVEKYNLTITNDALNLFVSEIDNNLYLIENELLKLINGISKSVVEIEDITKYTYLQTTHTVFELLDSIIKNQKTKALLLLKEYFDNSQPSEIIRFYSLLYMQFQKIVVFKYYRAKGYTFDTSAKEAKLNYFDKKKMKLNSVKFSIILKKYETVLEYEPLIKFGGNNTFYILENMIIKLLEEKS